MLLRYIQAQITVGSVLINTQQFFFIEWFDIDQFAALFW